MVEFCRLTSAQDGWFAQAFAVYEASFPRREQRLLARQAALMPNPLYHFDVLVDEGAFAGILLHWEGTGYEYVEHFAVRPSLRGREIGAKALGRFCEEHAFVILEIDPPVDDIAIRRQGFYRRLGFKTNGYAHLHPAYHSQFVPHELVVMSHPRPLGEEEYQLFRRELAETVMKDAGGSAVCQSI